MSLLPHFLVLFFASESEGRAKALWKDENGIGHSLVPFPNAKIARINDMANFFEQKMSLFPLLKKKRLSLVAKEALLSQKRNVRAGQQKSVFLTEELSIKTNLNTFFSVKPKIIAFHSS